MKSFTLKANLLAGLSHTINILTPQQKCCVAIDPVEANALALKIVKDLETCNGQFMEATKKTSDLLKARFDELTKELNTESEGMSDEEKHKLAALKTNIYRKDSEVLNSQSEAKSDVLVHCSLSDEKIEALKKLVRLTVNSWTNSEFFVETAQAVDNASIPQLDLQEV